MLPNDVPTLTIGDLTICPPIIQGGMGVKISGANLAGAAANAGCAGVIASVGLGSFESYQGDDFVTLSDAALRNEIRKARGISSGVIGVNIMAALSNYENLVATAVSEDVDFIIVGAGLPLDLPGHLNGKNIKLIPVVSSARTFSIICKRWKHHFDRLPDAVIVEGIKAGGHLGYSEDQALNDTAPTLEQIVQDVLGIANAFETPIPVIAAGGIFDGSDIARFLALGASGVQMATRFVCTDECDAHPAFKQAYIDAGPDDITIIKSPVGLPGRVINNAFVEQIKQGKTVPFSCDYQCLRTCDPQKAPYCIANVLSYAALGRLHESFAFAGANAWRCSQIVPVATLVDTLMVEFAAARALSLQEKIPSA